MSDSFIVAEEVGIAAVDQGESGYLHVQANYPDVEWKIVSHDLSLIEEGDDLRLGGRYAHSKKPAHEALSSLISFLLAQAEASGPGSDNWDIFSEDTRDWAKQNSDSLQMLAIELEEESS